MLFVRKTNNISGGSCSRKSVSCVHVMMSPIQCYKNGEHVHTFEKRRRLRSSFSFLRSESVMAASKLPLWLMERRLRAYDPAVAWLSIGRNTFCGIRSLIRGTIHGQVRQSALCASLEDPGFDAQRYCQDVDHSGRNRDKRSFR
ncbi:hypothetical protein PsorP6_009534 [Peronosclerospora sorghi]|uniref:Uncharacterized protein n=1 Tax=Peronosclerospora sorghi TaxID=230839 RepID=A0ACC0W023_9STRA|nr:hypothetical protein PsorP6_009534 [Peronosclerospora sorghi]